MAMFTGAQADAQINLGNILKNVVSGSKEKTEKENSASTEKSGGLLSTLSNIFSGDKVATKDKIIGTWVYESETFSHTYVFNSNLTGREIEVSKDSHGSVTSTYEENFEYSLSSDANGYNYVLIVSESSSTRQRYEITNSRLLLYINSNTYYEYRKQ